MNCTGHPLTPPPALMCSMASRAASEIFLVIGAIEPVNGRMPPILTGQETCAAAVPVSSMRAASAPPICPSIVTFPLLAAFGRMVRHHGLLADQAARPPQQRKH